MATATIRQHITRRARGAVLNWFEKHALSPAEFYEQLQERGGFGDDRDLMAYLRERYGEDEADALREGISVEMDRLFEERLGSLGHQLSGATTGPARDRIWQKERPRLLLLYLPDALFATAVEGACVRMPLNFDSRYDAPPPSAQDYVNGIFEEQGIPYRLNADGLMEWVGDETVQALAIAPSLAALRDPRLATAGEDFEHALANVRRGTAKARKDAVNDATKALEGTMVAVLEANSHTPPQRRQVMVLWQAVRDHGLVPQELMEVLTAGSKVSNARSRHTNATPVSQAEAEASVAAVATAITYLATRLPWRNGAGS